MSDDITRDRPEAVAAATEADLHIGTEFYIPEILAKIHPDVLRVAEEEVRQGLEISNPDLTDPQKDLITRSIRYIKVIEPHLAKNLTPEPSASYLDHEKHYCAATEPSPTEAK